MNLTFVNSSSVIGLGFILLFFGLILIYSIAGRKHPAQIFRELPAFSRLVKAVGLAVEAGKRLHLSLGWGGIFGLRGASGFVGLAVLQRIARVASISDRPPIATSGEGTLGILSQDTLSGAYRSMGAASQYSPAQGQVTGLTPFAYAAGTLPVIFDQQVSANLLAGHFGPEVVLITDAGERSNSLTVAGSDSLPAQAVLYAAAQEPLIGEELYASGAYMQAGPLHTASLRAEDFVRWVIVLAILAGAVLKLAGAL